MSDDAPEPSAPEPAPARRPGGRWQVGMRTLVLLMAAVAVWTAHALNLRQNEALEARIRTMIPLARELVVDDPRQTAAVKLEPYWFDESRWEVYLPEGTSFRLCLATRGVDEDGLPSAFKCVPLPAGRHRVELEQKPHEKGWRVVVTVDGAERVVADEPKGWDPAVGSSGGSHFSTSEQQPAAKPAVLFRRRFNREVTKGQPRSPSGPSEGILLWIEPDAAANAGPSAPSGR